jgi:hypothetical protein
LRYINKTPESDKAAIDYFVKYAGFDENGNQTGPMAGGLVVFAAGNDAVNVGYPSDYENCMAVSAIAGDYTEAYYTNYGDWVDIAAPGGDEFKNHLVISTVPDNKYAGFQGTSMACPHVSGVAATWAAPVLLVMCSETCWRIQPGIYRLIQTLPNTWAWDLWMSRKHFMLSVMWHRSL